MSSLEAYSLQHLPKCLIRGIQVLSGVEYLLLGRLGLHLVLLLDFLLHYLHARRKGESQLDVLNMLLRDLKQDSH